MDPMTLAAAGNFIGKVGGLFSKKKTPAPPPQVAKGLQGMERSAGEVEGFANDYRDVIMPQFRGISDRFEAHRGALDSFQDYANKERVVLDRQAPLWNQLESRVASDALGRPASVADAARIGSRRNEASLAAMSGMRQQQNADALRSMASGLGPQAGGSWDAARGGFMAGVAGDTAAQQERMYLQESRRALLPYADRMRQQRMALAKMPANVQREAAESYGRLGDAYNRLMSPALSAYGQAANIYSGMVSGGIKSFEAGAIHTQLNNQRREQMWDMGSSVLSDVSDWLG